jgi:cellulose synthase/poly-beta-1,6-N-acetylglucosamine synthase-like glycosyltransferase
MVLTHHKINFNITWPNSFADFFRSLLNRHSVRSKDKTEEMVIAAGIPCIKELNQGITNARNAGLAVAKGKYILNTDADTIYPKDWMEEMVKLLAENEKVCSVYGRFSFTPIGNTGRFTYFVMNFCRFNAVDELII